VLFFLRNVLFGSFSSYVLALAPKFCTKNARVNLDEIDTSILALKSRKAIWGLVFVILVLCSTLNVKSKVFFIIYLKLFLG
jgi:hypothetical protein